MSQLSKQPMVKYLDETPAIDCPYGNVRRIVTGGAGGIANVHIVAVTEGSPHLHSGYDEVYYVLNGRGSINIAGEEYELRPGAAVVIPAGTLHSLKAIHGQVLEFVIFGTPAMSIDDERAKPRKS